MTDREPVDIMGVFAFPNPNKDERVIRFMAEYLIKEMARKQGETEQLKAENMMKWVGLMNNILACADEIVFNDIVYS